MYVPFVHTLLLLVLAQMIRCDPLVTEFMMY